MNPPLANALALCGILLGSIGAAILYWESVINEDEIANTAVQILRNTGNLDRSDKAVIKFNMLVGLILLVRLSKRTLSQYEALDTARFIFGVTIIVLISSAAPVATWGALKAAALWKRGLARQLDAKSDFDGRKGYISRFYRLSGMTFVVVGAFAQIPLILSTG